MQKDGIFLKDAALLFIKVWFTALLARGAKLSLRLGFVLAAGLLKLSFHAVILIVGLEEFSIVARQFWLLSF